MRITHRLRRATTLGLALHGTLLVWCACSFALNPDRHISQYGHSVWRIRDGIFDGTPIVLTQTADGYLWIGTSIGLVRFDGVRFSAWNPPAGQRLFDPRVFSILAAHDGSLWIGAGYGVARLSNRNLIHYPQITGRIESMVEDADGTVWLVRTQSTDGMGPLCSIKDERTQCYGPANGIPFPLAIKLQTGSSGELWVGGYYELCRWKAGTCSAYLTRRRHPETFASLRGVAAARDGSAWAAIDESKSHLQLQHFEGGKWTTRDFPGIKISNADVTTLFVDSNDVLWVGTAQHGIWRVRDNEFDHFGSTDGLSSDSVYGFYEDSEGNLWVITSEGIENFRDLRVTSFSTPEGLSADGATSVVTAPDGTVWIGNFQALDALRGKTVSGIRTGQGLPGRNVTTLFEDHAGRLWVGVDDGLWVYDSNRFSAVRRSNGNALGIVFAITEDVKHTMWVRAGPNLDRIENLRVTSETTSPQISTAYALAASPQGGIVLGLVNGDLVRIKDGTVQTLSSGAVDNSPQIRDLLVQSDGSVWGTTLDGVFRWKEGVRKNLTTHNGLPCDGIFALVRDNRDSLWVDSRCGLIRIDESELNEWWDDPNKFVKFQLFDTSDGVSPGLTSLKPQTARSPNGLLWFVNGKSLQTIDPGRTQLNSLPPPVHIEEIVADHKTYALQDRLGLPPLTRDLEIKYAALSFVAPQKVRFRYKLEGHDQDWQDPGTRREAFYSDLRPGTYSFHVIASNNEGIWNNAGATLEFSVAPAWFQTPWFGVACAVLLLSLLWMLYQLRLRQMHRQFSIGLEARVQERTRIARELHDTLLQSFQGLVLVFQGAIKLLPERPKEARERLESALDQAEKAIAEGRDAVQDLRASTMESNDLAMALTALAEGLAPNSGRNPPVVHVAVEGAAKNLHPILRDEVYRIAGEALRNAFRHAQARRIEAEILYGDQELRVRIRDDGKGMEKVVQGQGRAGHWGLRGMRERAMLVGGTLEVWSSEDSGTEVELCVPAARAYTGSGKSRGHWFARMFFRKHL